jgi:uncharacterized LabA/DUF88 family protein
MRTIVYIDGFNLYYGAIKGSPYKWLDLCALCDQLLPRNQIVQVKYYTALVKPRPSDLDAPVRQQTFLRALRTLPRIEIVLGTFLSHVVAMPLARPSPGGPNVIQVIKTEEKGSDVNIASHLISDGYQDRYEVAVLVSNDSDLAEPVRIVREELGKPVGIVNPHNQHPSRTLIKYASFIRQIRVGLLQACQLPPVLTDSNGVFHKPSAW